jgi:transposase
MRGSDQQQGEVFSYLSPESRVRKDHPLRAIRTRVDEVLRALSPEFDRMYARQGRPSIAPEKLLRAQMLQMLYSVRSERLLMEEIDYSILFRWFIGLNLDEEVWDATTFTKNRDRLLKADVAKQFLAEVVELARAQGLVSDEHAAMLTHSKKVRTMRYIIAFAALASLAGNITTFYLFGFNPIVTLILAAGATALALVAGHPAYEHVVARHKKLQAAITVLGVVLVALGVMRLAEARHLEIDKTAAAAPTAGPYVYGAPAERPIDEDQKAGESTEAKVRATFGEAMFYIMLAAELLLGFLVGKLGKMSDDEDYAAWQRLHEITRLITKLEETMSGLLSYIEIAKKRCVAGMLRALNTRSYRKPPYHGTGSLLLLCMLVGGVAHAQTIEHKEGILIDVSGSIGKGGATSDLFREYLISTRSLLLSEPAKTRVWVSSISSDSFGGVREIVKGWTPEARGIFTDDLDRARHQLATSFAKNASGMSPASAGTDIFGGLWHLKTLFESGAASGDRGASKTIWIFSDMINETHSFLMPALLSLGADQMLQRAKEIGLVVPMNGYKIYIYGATPNGLTPQAWLTVKSFWTLYFQVAGAELVAYSAEFEVQR